MPDGFDIVSPIAPLPDAAINLSPPVAVVEVTPAPGRYPARCRAGESFHVRACAVAPEGAPELAGVLRWRRALAPRWEELPLVALGEGRFEVEWTPADHGEYEWCVELSPAGVDGRDGSSGGDVLHCLWVDRGDLGDASWAQLGREPFAEVSARVAGGGLGDVGIVLLAPIFPAGQGGAPGCEGAGHYSIDPELGDTQSFGALAGVARAAGVSLAMTVPLACSAAHPFREKFPEAFAHGGDHADFTAAGWRDFWSAWSAVFRFWLVQGIDIFHVPDAAHAPVAFWQSLIESLREDFPDIVFTAPGDVLQTPYGEHLAGVGFIVAGLSQDAVPPVEPEPLAPLEPLEPASPDSAGVACACSNPALAVTLHQRDGGGVLRVENAAPDSAQSGHVHLPGELLGITEHDRFYLRDLADGRAYRWSGTTNFLALAAGDPAKSYRIERN